MKRFIYWFAAAAVINLAAGCGPDTSGEPTPAPQLRIWVGDQPAKEVVIYDEAGNLVKTVGAAGTFSKPNAIDVYKTDGSTWVCDFYTNRVRKFNVAGDPLFATAADGEPLVRNATMLSVGQANGECWVADRGHDRVIRLKADGATLAKVTGFKYPRSVAVDPASGNVWVTDEGNDAVVLILGTAAGDVPVNAVEITRFADINNPWAVAADGNGDGWATSKVDGLVYRLSSAGVVKGTAGGFVEPMDVAVNDNANAVYVLDAATGSLAALPRNLTGNVEDYRTVALFVIPAFSNPGDVYVDGAAGRIYVADTGAGELGVYDAEGTEIRVLTGVGRPGVVAAFDSAELP